MNIDQIGGIRLPCIRAWYQPRPPLSATLGTYSSWETIIELLTWSVFAWLNRASDLIETTLVYSLLLVLGVFNFASVPTEFDFSEHYIHKLIVWTEGLWQNGTNQAHCGVTLRNFLCAVFFLCHQGRNIIRQTEGREDWSGEEGDPRKTHKISFHQHLLPREGILHLLPWFHQPAPSRGDHWQSEVHEAPWQRVSEIATKGWPVSLSPIFCWHQNKSSVTV